MGGWADAFRVGLGAVDEDRRCGLHRPFGGRRGGQDVVGAGRCELQREGVDDQDRQCPTVGEFGVDEEIGVGKLRTHRVAVQLGRHHHEADAEIAQLLGTSGAERVGGDPHGAHGSRGGNCRGQQFLTGVDQSGVGLGASGRDGRRDVERHDRERDEFVTFERGGEALGPRWCRRHLCHERRRDLEGDWCVERRREVDGFVEGCLGGCAFGRGCSW